MRSHHPTYQGLISQALAQVKGSNYFQRTQIFLATLRPLLSKLNRDKFGDLRAQQEKARQKLAEIQESLSATPRDPFLLQQELKLRLQYSDIISSSLSLMREESKMDLIELGDAGSRLFFARAKQSKMSSYIYTLKNDEGSKVEGFDQVGKIMSKFYTQLLGTEV